MVYSFIHHNNSCAHLFPTAPKHIINYIMYTDNRGLSPSIITSQLSAISYWHKLAGVSDPIKQFLVQKMLVGTRKMKPQCGVRLPITQYILRLLIKAVDATSTAPYYNSMLNAMFLLVFNTFLLVGEFTITHTSGPHHALQLGDVSVLLRDSTESLSITMNIVTVPQLFCVLLHKIE